MRTRLWWVGCLGAALVLSVGQLAAQDGLRTRLSLSYAGAPATQVLEAVAKVLGFRLQVGQGVGGLVTLDVRNVTVDTALRVICDEVGCRWRVEKMVLIVEPDPRSPAPTRDGPLASLRLDDVHSDVPLQILWTNAPLGAAAATVARMLSADLVIDAALNEKRISLNQEKNTLWAALRTICGQAGCRWRLVTTPRRVLMFVPVEPQDRGNEFASGVPRVGEPGVEAPRLVSSMRPVYPAAASQSKTQGTVDVECVVRTDGTVGEARVVSSPRSLANKHGLDQEAVIAAKLHLFEPGRKNGQPSAVVVQLSFAFTAR